MSVQCKLTFDKYHGTWDNLKTILKQDDAVGTWEVVCDGAPLPSHGTLSVLNVISVTTDSDYAMSQYGRPVEVSDKCSYFYAAESPSGFFSEFRRLAADEVRRLIDQKDPAPFVLSLATASDMKQCNALRAKSSAKMSAGTSKMKESCIRAVGQFDAALNPADIATLVTINRHALSIIGTKDIRDLLDDFTPYQRAVSYFMLRTVLGHAVFPYDE
jgi:hypothetical protein